MEVTMQEMCKSMQQGLERLAAVVGSLETTAKRLEEGAHAGGVHKITAAVEDQRDGHPEMDLAQRLAELEYTFASMRGSASSQGIASQARKTLPSATVQLLAKQGIDAMDEVDLPSLDAALAGMSVEHRIAVKSQLMRTGALAL